MPIPKREALRRFASYWGVRVADRPACRGHSAPLDFLAAWVLDRPPISLVHGPRGGGKSFLAALATHLNSLRYDRHGTRILGGSLAQSQQIYDALAEFEAARPDASPFTSFTKTSARYVTGSDVSILSASRTSVRGPHVPTLCLDEVDEIEPEIREAATGMCMERRGVSASISMTSTWHNVGGPMAGLVERGDRGDFPLFRFCTFDVLERCPEARSGPFVGGEALYERCPACPLVKWCHSERDRNGGRPLAKLSAGHYAIDSLIQKVRANSLRTFEADYLCRGPKADGVWFKDFDDRANVTEDAEFDPALPVHDSIDSGVFTGAVLFQVRRGAPGRHRVNVFADYLTEGLGAEDNASAIVRLIGSRCGPAAVVHSTDPAGGSRNAIGPTVVAEYERAGLRPLRRWPVGPKADRLAFVEGLICSADGTRALTVHPRCKATIAALKAYRRAKRAGQWMDWPEDPQHPHEELVDALAGGLMVEFPEGNGQGRGGSAVEPGPGYGPLRPARR
jgi:hypothetical protein